MTHRQFTPITYNGITISYCFDCKYNHQMPLPTQEEVDAYYGEQDAFYTSYAAKDWFAKEEREHKAGLWRAYYDYKLSLLGEHQRILDVGSGTGWFVRHVNQHSTSVAYGYEPSAAARQANEVLGVFGDEPPRSLAFDAIHMALVLEHVVDPAQTIMHWSKRLKPHGKMLIVVPNDLSPLQERLHSHHFVSKVHLNYFTPITLGRLMERCGFRVTHESATFPFELLQLAGVHYIGNDKLGRKCHQARLRFEQALGPRAFKIYEKLYKKYWWGRELIFVGEKI